MSSTEKQIINLKSIIIGCVVLLIGIASILFDVFLIKSSQDLWISIGCSLIASAMVTIINAIVVEKRSANPIDEWGIEKIYETRAEKNADSHKKLPKISTQLDVVAFGLKSFRDSQNKTVESLLRKGVNIRILTMNPQSVYVKQREAEENETEGQIRKTIELLIDWAEKKNKRDWKGKVSIKGYNCMTLDFYWRMDDEMYIGPYWYGKDSQQTITYKFSKGKAGFKTYSDYFEDLWGDSSMTVLVDGRNEIKELNR